MAVTTVQISGIDHAQQIAQQAGQILAEGGLVVFPTETVYGVAASVGSGRGLEALRSLKRHTGRQPFTVHLPDPAAAERYIELDAPVVRRLVSKVFPGPVTLVVDVSDEVIATKVRNMDLDGPPAEVAGRIYHHNTVGLRCPDHLLAQQILGACGAPVVASSANMPGQVPPRTADEAAALVGDAVALVVDGGPCRYAKPSTIVRVRHSPSGVKVTVDRPGVYDERFIRKLMRWTVLLVCSGNTCRSPMAEGLAKQMLAEQRGVPVEELELAGVRVLSAGAFASPGSPASPEAVEAMKKGGVDIAGHRSRMLSPELVHEADVVYCMTRGHVDTVTALVPSAAEKVFTLDPGGDIDDPIGSGPTAYQRCAELIRRRLAQRLKEQQP